MAIETDTEDEMSEECDEALFELIEKTEADTDFHVDGRLQARVSVKIEFYFWLIDDTVQFGQAIISVSHDPYLLVPWP